MSRMLNLAEGLLSMGRTHQNLGRVRNALTILSRVLRLRELPPDVAEETQARLGELQLQRKRYQRARRHYLIALRYAPDNALYHQRLARALSEQDSELWDRASTHYRRALELDPEHVETLTEFGLLNVKMGQAEAGIELLRKAVALKPADPDVLSRLIKGYRWTGRTEDAQQALREGMFRNARDRRFRRLWETFEFRMARRQQRRQAGQAPREVEAPVLLPFLRLATQVSRPQVSPSTGEAALVPVSRLGRAGRAIDQRQVR